MIQSLIQSIHHKFFNNYNLQDFGDELNSFYTAMIILAMSCFMSYKTCIDSPINCSSSNLSENIKLVDYYNCYCQTVNMIRLEEIESKFNDSNNKVI